VSAVREYLNAHAATSRRAVPTRSRRLVHLSDDPRQIVVYQYAANDFSVIGLAYGRPGHRPSNVVVCADPLDRAGVAAALEPVRDDLLSWLAAHSVHLGHSRTGREVFSADDAPQLIVAGAGVLTALDNLSYDWRFNDQLDPAWATLGEELWTLCDLARWPAQPFVIPLAETLAEHYAFGISELETAKLAVLVELLDADPVTGATLTQLRAAERAESGPLGRPEEIDQPVWEAVRAGRRVPAVVRRTLLATWDRCNRAHAHLTALPEAACATAAAEKLTDAWARRIHAARTNSTYRRRRALPSLAAAGSELGWMERDHAQFTADAALEDPMYAAELAGDGKAFHADLTFNTTTVARKTTVQIEATTRGALVPPASGATLGLGGTKARALLTSVTPEPGGEWRLRMHVDAETGGVRAAQVLPDGTFWLVPVAKEGPPPASAPATAPPTHPFARGRRTPSGATGAGA